MNEKTILTITSLLSILLFTLHWVDDIVRGMASGGFSGFGGILILIIWLYGTLVLGGQRSGYIVMLLGAMLGLVALVLHMRGSGLVSDRTTKSGGVFFWVWTLFALGVTSTFSLILSARGLWRAQRAKSR